MKSAIGLIGLAACLSACGQPGEPGRGGVVTAANAKVSANEMTIDTLGGGAFRGSAGAAWTADEIAAQVAGLECGGKRPGTINVAPAPGGYSFNGRC